MSDEIVNIEEVRCAIGKLKVNKSNGLDGLKSEFFIDAFDSSVPLVLSWIFTGMFVLGIMPNDFNISMITSIPKIKNTGSDPSNFRSISVSSTFSLLFGLILDGRMNLNIHLNQFGFKKPN